MRNVLFVSHANPDDNEFALWLTLQLARRGYATWCDLTKLLGGEDFWSDIETTIRERAAKLLYILSSDSNHRPGVIKELSLAEAVAKSRKLSDFIVPLKVDALPHAEANIRVHHLNAVPFHRGWAAGLHQLLEKLEQDGVPKHPAFSADAVAEWWRHHRPSDEGVERRPEAYLTNWFPVELPAAINVHRLVRQGGGPTQLPPGLPFPGAKHGAYLVSFAPSEEILPVVSAPDRLIDSASYPLPEFLAGRIAEIPIDRTDARKHVAHLLREAWEAEARRRGMAEFELSSGRKCFYFTKGMIEDDSVRFHGAGGRRTHRQVVGYSTVSAGQGKEPGRRYWHFGVQLKPLLHPLAAFAAKPHVLFSSDGLTVWGDPRRLHRARRSACKHWWNPAWRDRILASLAWLAGEQGEIVLPVASNARLVLAPRPVGLTSPVAFDDPVQLEPTIDTDYEDEWAEDEEDGEAA